MRRDQVAGAPTAGYCAAGRQAAEAEEEGAVAVGTVKWYSPNRGYGFIASEQAQAVEFDVEQDPRGKGLRAVNVRLVDAH